MKDATDPYVADVEIEAVRESVDSSSGIVVCYIPASSFAPHQALWGERTYFVRTQDSNIPCPQPLLRNLFYPRTAPRLIPNARLSVTNGDDHLLHIGISVTLQNLGSASAQDTFVQVSATGDRGFECHPAQFWLPRPFSTGFECKVAIHPHQTIPFLNNMSHRGGYYLEGLPKLIRCEFRIFTQHGSALFSEIEFGNEELKKAATQLHGIFRDGKTTLLNI